MTLFTYIGDHYKYLAYANSGNFNGMFVGTRESPIIKVDGFMLIGVLNNPYLQQYLLVNNHQVKDTGYKSVLQSFDFLKTYEKFQESTMLIVTIDGLIYMWVNGLMYDIKGRYMAIGESMEMVMGCLYGLRASQYTDKERVEITLNAVSYNRPNQSMSRAFEMI